MSIFNKSDFESFRDAERRLRIFILPDTYEEYLDMVRKGREEDMKNKGDT